MGLNGDLGLTQEQKLLRKEPVPADHREAQMKTHFAPCVSHARSEIAIYKKERIGLTDGMAEENR